MMFAGEALRPNVRPSKTQAVGGFSLLEVLITIVVVAIGLLGVAGLQVSSIKLSRVADARSQGVVYAADILDRMRSNLTVSAGAINGMNISSSISAYATDYTSPATSSSTQAERDLRDWKAQLARLPGGGEGKIEITDAASSACVDAKFTNCIEVTVSIRWTESNVAGGATLPIEFVTRARL